jgi:hypothetical protein
MTRITADDGHDNSGYGKSLVSRKDAKLRRRAKDEKLDNCGPGSEGCLFVNFMDADGAAVNSKTR